jgi:16S rRNA (cytosine967-C5)-methyltransferase
MGVPNPSISRQLAFQALTEASARELVPERHLRTLFERTRCGRDDRALATFLVQETLRRRGELDYRIAAVLRDPIEALPGPVLETLRLGLVQLLYFERVPKHAAVGEAVELVKAAGYDRHAGLVNAVLRRMASGDVPPLPSGDGDDAVAARASFPVWLVHRWRRYGDRLGELLDGSNRHPPLVLRVDPSRITVEAVLAELEASGIGAHRGRLAAECVHVTGRIDLQTFMPFAAGAVSVQDESEALVVRLVDPRPENRIVDLCAAPGGKTLHLLERTDGLGFVVATDPSLGRLRRVVSNLDRTGRVAHLVAADARHPPFRVPFDRVLLDAPCTGTGVLARRADARWRLTPDALDAAAEIQWALLEAAAKLVASDGILAYSVCSIEPEETDELIDRFLDVHPSFREEPAPEIPIGARGANGRLTLLPGEHGCDGVFGVRLRRSS